MPTAVTAPPLNGTRTTLAALVARIGSVPLDRIVAWPAPGTATESDLLSLSGDKKQLCELVDGVLVEKAMGYYESMLAAALIRLLGSFVAEHDLGLVLAPDGLLRLKPGLIRLPDVAFISWDHFPGRELPPGAFLDVAPDLAVEVLSPGNTDPEMERKVREYFSAGTRLVWVVDARRRVVQVHHDAGEGVELSEHQELQGGDVLPGFRLTIRTWLDQVGRQRSGD